MTSLVLNNKYNCLNYYLYILLHNKESKFKVGSYLFLGLVTDRQLFAVFLDPLLRLLHYQTQLTLFCPLQVSHTQNS